MSATIAMSCGVPMRRAGVTRGAGGEQGRLALGAERVVGARVDGAGEVLASASGALFIYEADSIATAREILAADPYEIGGVFTHCQLSQWEVIKANPALLRELR